MQPRRLRVALLIWLICSKQGLGAAALTPSTLGQTAGINFVAGVAIEHKLYAW